MEKFQPNIEAFIAGLPEGTVVQLSLFQPAGTDKQVLALVLSGDQLSTQAGINTIDDGLRAQDDKRRQAMVNRLLKSGQVGETDQQIAPAA